VRQLFGCNNTKQFFVDVPSCSTPVSLDREFFLDYAPLFLSFGSLATCLLSFIRLGQQFEFCLARAGGGLFVGAGREFLQSASH
jgi:hypothetical protein